MPRPIEISRDEAEMLVDLLEGNKPLRGDLQPELAAEIRKLFGMVTREEQEFHEKRNALRT